MKFVKTLLVALTMSLAAEAPASADRLLGFAGQRRKQKLAA